jgi:D-beta-D-heptose 7-phosphate kinase/D-beta-D-heptose 1-phosphate adenosyltransferase
MGEEKKQIVAVSGYFDPIHSGHIEYLKLAKEIADKNNAKLVVILNNSKQTELKKGQEFMPLADRLNVVKAIKYVDEVFISIDEDRSVSKSLEALNPLIFAKGGDRFSGEIPEKETCDRLGIRIIDGLGAKIQSSSSLIRDWKVKNV